MLDHHTNKYSGKNLPFGGGKQKSPIEREVSIWTRNYDRIQKSPDVKPAPF